MGKATLIPRGTGRRVTCSTESKITKSLLGYGVIAGPFYVIVVLVQALTRPGFNLAHDDASLLSNGGAGWIQIANFVVTGTMVIAAAVGLRRALGSGPGAAWGPRLLGAFGLGMIGAGLFVADPMDGFPAGAPAGRPAVITVHGMLHIATAGIGFLCLVAACIAIAQRLASVGQVWWARSSRVAGVVFFLGFAGVASGSDATAVVAAFWVAILAAFAWLSSTSLHMYKIVAATDAPLA
jgi:Protein of unknown function (DUF998)